MNSYKEKISNLMNKSLEIDCVPIGAIVVEKGKIIGEGYNKKNKTNLVTDHAEILAINEACLMKNDWRLEDCELYVTLFPCMMCLGAIEASRIKKVYYYVDKIEHGEIVNNNWLTDIKFVKESSNGIFEENLKTFFDNKRKSD